MKKLRTSYLLPAELSETISNYLKAIANVTLADTFIARITGLLERDNQLLKEAITAVRINKWVDDVSDADALRDDLFIGFRDMIDAYRRRKDEDMVRAYETLWPVLEKAGTRLYALGYTEQSGKIDALFQELNKQKNQEAMTTLGLVDLYADLKQSQEDFTAVYNNRLDEDAKQNYPTLKEATRRAIPHVNILIDAIGILEETEPEVHKDLVSKINAITTEITSIALTRKSKSKPVADDDEF